MVREILLILIMSFNLFKMFQIMIFQGIDEGILCRIFTLTFAVKARNWCRTLPAASIHSWDQFVTIFICKFDGYNYEQVCDEIEYL